MHTYATDTHLIVRLDTGDLALESIQAAIEEHGVDTGCVVSGIGTFRNLRIHYLATTDLDDPDRDTMFESDEPWEITGIQGAIADGEPHLHVTAFDGERTVAGHLEPGNEVNALGEVVIQRIPGLELTRTPNAHDVDTLESR
jgi:predicted DNA-binding protein with PD1-like motif